MNVPQAVLSLFCSSLWGSCLLVSERDVTCRFCLCQVCVCSPRPAVTASSTSSTWRTATAWSRLSTTTLPPSLPSSFPVCAHAPPHSLPTLSHSLYVTHSLPIQGIMKRAAAAGAAESQRSCLPNVPVAAQQSGSSWAALTIFMHSGPPSLSLCPIPSFLPSSAAATALLSVNPWLIPLQINHVSFGPLIPESQRRYGGRSYFVTLWNRLHVERHKK